MKIQALVRNCGDCEYLFSDGISKTSKLYCGRLIEAKEIKKDEDIPEWCPLEDYKEVEKC